jgi:hypothetical protein
MWDGMGFFGFDDTKLARLKGKKVTFMTKFSSPKSLFFSLLSLSIVLFVIISEAATLG